MPPPFRAEHIGSLLRPAELLLAHHNHANNNLSDAAFRALQDKCIIDVVRMQEDVGLQLVTDGEFRRGSYWSHFVQGVQGFTVKNARYTFRDGEGRESQFTAPHTEGKLKRRGGLSTAEFSFVRSVTKRMPKITMPSPPTMHFWRGRQGVDESVYADLEDFFVDLAQVYRDEIADLVRDGARYIQMDDVPFAMLCDNHIRDLLESEGENPDKLTTTYINLINDSLRNQSTEVTVGLHICRGNYKGKWLSEGGYDALAERLFNEVNVNVFFLEYDSPRAGGFRILRFLPHHKRVVLGLVSSKTANLESITDLQQRISEASRFVPLEQLGISPQCGFASTVGGNPLTMDDQTKKLQIVVQTARAVWGDS